MKRLQRKLVTLLCVSLLLPFTPLQTAAQNKSQITVEVGQPNIWSLGQAHYLLANMRDRSRDLSTKVPLTDLDPNSANGSRLNILRTLISAEGSFNGVNGAQNEMLTRKFETEFARSQAAQTRLDALIPQYTAAVSEVASLGVQVSALTGTDQAAVDQKKVLNEQLARKTAEREALKAEIDILRQQAGVPGSQTLVPSSLAGGGGSSNGLNDDLKDLIGKLSAGASNSRLSASTALDNYVQMQYEVIAKQLTLLRDEIGPEQRLIFLELPMSLYSVPKKDDDYVVQVKWDILRFFGPPQLNVETKVLESKVNNYARPASTPASEPAAEQNQQEPITLDIINELTRLKADLREKNRTFDAEYKLKDKYKTLEGMDWTTAEPSKFRVVDIIPRQSALNINDTQGTQKGLALTAKFLSVFGFGGQVGFQRQRTIYEQFLQQEVYASAFGKGLSDFGWTFGPLPGTRRLAPGVRTTYAILAIPRDAMALELKVNARVFKRNVPQDDASVKPLAQVNEGFGEGTFRILVPNEKTEGFWVNSVVYTPVEAGQQATMIIKGDYFSPLTGILVNGVPLKRAVSIGKNESDSKTLPVAVDPAGEYEYLNPNEIIMSLKMPSTYTGTPIITLVTPEKTSSINFFNLDTINFHFKNESLADASLIEPMFLEKLDVTGAELVEEKGDYIKVNLLGKGLRRGAQILVNNVELPDAQVKHINTGLYELVFQRPEAGRPAVITYRNTTRQGAEQDAFTFQQNIVSNYEILRYEPASKGNAAVLDLVLTASGQGGVPRVDIDPRDGEVLSQPVPLGGDKYRLQITAKNDPVSLSVTSVTGVTRIFDVGLPYPPSVDAVINATTGKAEGPANKNAVVTIRGSNFQHVVRVLFGGKEATIMQVDPQVILVTAPTGEEGAVQVLLETNVKYRARAVSNIADFRTQGKAVYTYTK